MNPNVITKSVGNEIGSKVINSTRILIEIADQYSNTIIHIDIIVFDPS